MSYEGEPEQTVNSIKFHLREGHSGPELRSLLLNGKPLESHVFGITIDAQPNDIPTVTLNLHAADADVELPEAHVTVQHVGIPTEWAAVWEGTIAEVTETDVETVRKVLRSANWFHHGMHQTTPATTPTEG